MSATAFQPEPSANAPCTRTTFLIFVIVILLSSLSFSESCISLEHEGIVPGNGHDTIEDTDHFCGFLLQMRSEDLFVCGRGSLFAYFDEHPAVCVLTPPLPRCRANNVCKCPGKSGLIGKSGLRRDFHERAVRFGQKDFGDLHAPQSEVTMWGGPKRSPERSRKMAGRKPAFPGKSL